MKFLIPLVAVVAALSNQGCYAPEAHAITPTFEHVHDVPEALTLSTVLRNAIVQQVQIEADADAGANSAASLVICSDASAQSNCASYVPGAVCTGASVVLAELAMSSPSAPAAAGGVLTFSAITSDSSANATGTASWFTLLDQPDDGSAECVYTGSVSTAGADINLNTTSIVAGATVSITSATVTAPGA